MKNKIGRNLISTGILWVLVVVTFIPIYLMVITSFKSDMQMYASLLTPVWPPNLNTYVEAFKYTIPFLINSLIVTVGVTVLSLICSILAAFAFYRFDFPLKNFLFSALLALMMVPGFMTLAPQFIIARNLNILNTYIVQILPLTGAVSVLSTFLIRTYLDGLPKSLFEASEVEGANNLQVLWHIVVPLCIPVLTIVFINNSVQAWNNYIWPLVSANLETVRPVVIAIKNTPMPDYFSYGTKFASYVITSIPLLILFAFNSKAFVSGITSGAVKA